MNTIPNTIENIETAQSLIVSFNKSLEAMSQDPTNDQTDLEALGIAQAKIMEAFIALSQMKQAKTV
jgi:hypothetical protein